MNCNKEDYAKILRQMANSMQETKNVSKSINIYESFMLIPLGHSKSKNDGRIWIPPRILRDFQQFLFLHPIGHLYPNFEMFYFNAIYKGMITVPGICERFWPSKFQSLWRPPDGGEESNSKFGQDFDDNSTIICSHWW